MEIASILMARAVAWIESADLNPTGVIFFPELTRAMVARYGFQKFPQKVEDFDESKGVTFASGRLVDVTIEQIIFYTFGIAVDTRVDTDISKNILEEGLSWAREEFKIKYEPSMVKRWQYVSQITFFSDAPIAVPKSPYKNFLNAVNRAIVETYKEHLNYDVAMLSIDHDTFNRKYPLGRFSIQRRENTPFSENKYYSDAPLPTKVHINLLKQFESDLLGLTI